MHLLQSSVVVGLLFGTVAWAHPTPQYPPNNLQMEGDSLLQACANRRVPPKPNAYQVDQAVLDCANNHPNQPVDARTAETVRRNVRIRYGLPPPTASLGDNRLRPAGVPAVNTPILTKDGGKPGGKPVKKQPPVQDPKDPEALKTAREGLMECTFDTIRGRANADQKPVTGEIVDAAVRICVHDEGWLSKLSQSSIQLVWRHMRGVLHAPLPNSSAKLDLRQRRAADEAMIYPMPGSSGQGSTTQMGFR